MRELTLFLSGDTGVGGICQRHLVNAVEFCVVQGTPQISSVKHAKLFTFKNTIRLMTDNLFMVLTSQPKHRAISSRAGALFLSSWVLGSSKIKAYAFLKSIILYLSPLWREMVTACGLNVGAGCLHSIWSIC